MEIQNSTIKREVEALHMKDMYFLRILMLHRTTNANKIEMVFFFFKFQHNASKNEVIYNTIKTSTLQHELREITMEVILTLYVNITKHYYGEGAYLPRLNIYI